MLSVVHWWNNFFIGRVSSLDVMQLQVCRWGLRRRPVGVDVWERPMSAAAKDDGQGRRADGGCVTEEKPGLLSRVLVSKAPARVSSSSRDSLCSSVDFYSHALKAFSKHSPCGGFGHHYVDTSMCVGMWSVGQSLVGLEMIFFSFLLLIQGLVKHLFIEYVQGRLDTN